MKKTISDNFSLSDEQRIFKLALSKYPRLEPYWDFDKRNCDVNKLRKDLGVLSSGEVIMARFLCGVWLGHNELDFDLIVAAKSLGPDEINFIIKWLSSPVFP